MRSVILDKAMAILQKIAGLLMLSMIVTVTIQLIARNFLKVSTPWTEDMAKLFLIWMTFLGSPVVLYKGEHLMVDLIYAKLSGNAKLAINLLMNMVISSFCIIIVKLGYDLCTNHIILRSTTAAAGIPRVWMFIALPVGGLLMLVVSLNSLVNIIIEYVHKTENKTPECKGDNRESGERKG